MNSDIHLVQQLRLYQTVLENTIIMTIQQDTWQLAARVGVPSCSNVGCSGVHEIFNVASSFIGWVHITIYMCEQMTYKIYLHVCDILIILSIQIGGQIGRLCSSRSGLLYIDIICSSICIHDYLYICISIYTTRYTVRFIRTIESYIGLFNFFWQQSSTY